MEMESGICQWRGNSKVRQELLKSVKNIREILLFSTALKVQTDKVDAKMEPQNFKIKPIEEKGKKLGWRYGIKEKQSKKKWRTQVRKCRKKMVGE